MAFWKVYQTQMITRTYIVEADSEEAAEEVMEDGPPDSVDTYYGGDMNQEIDGPYETEAEAS